MPLTLTAVSGVAPNEAGLASALLNTTQQVGGSLGLAVLSTVAISASSRLLASLGEAAHGHVTTTSIAIATTHGYTTAFRVGAIVAFIGFLISLVFIRTPAQIAHHSDVAPVGV